MTVAPPPAGGRFPPAVTFLPPALPNTVLQRTRLEARLGPAVASRLTLVTGPAGSGKTTLTRSWLTSLSTPWSWITVDRSLARSERFWPGVVRAVQLAVPELILNAPDVVESLRGDGSADEIVQVLVDDLLRPDDTDPITVVVDDGHLLDQPCWSGIEWVIGHQPPVLHLVIVSRADPPFPTARFKALGWMSEVRHTDLACTRDETATLVNRWTAAPVTEELIDALHARTEGWVAGLRLAAMTLEQGARPDEVLRTDDAAGTVLHELLITEALDQQPSDVRSFLQRTSILPVVEPAAGQAISGRADSRDLLRRLAADHVFVTPLSDHSDHYRYHPLLADVLRLELRASGGEAAAYEAAARWFEQEGRFAEAIDAALAGAQHELAFHLIVSHLADLYAGGHRADVGRWLLDLPDSFAAGDPERLVDHCAALLFVVRPEWHRWLRRARAVVGEDRPDLRARLRLYGALSVAGQGRLDLFEVQHARAAALDPHVVDDPFAEVITAWLARLATLHGDHARAVAAATEVYRRDRQLIRELPARSLLAATLHAAGDRSGADLAMDVIAAWRAIGEPDYLGMADALVVGSELALLAGDLDEAEILAGSAVGVTELPPPHLLNARAEISLASVYQTTGRAAEAEARLQRLRTTMAGFDAAPALLALLDEAMRDDSTATRPRQSPPLEPLTDRELTILGLLTSHLTFPEIGRELFISRHTVKTHVSRIYRKLGASSRSTAVRSARERGIM